MTDDTIHVIPLESPPNFPLLVWLLPPQSGFAGDQFRARYFDAHLNRLPDRPFVGNPRQSTGDHSRDLPAKIFLQGIEQVVEHRRRQRDRGAFDNRVVPRPDP
jgi:hypothetical protein